MAEISDLSDFRWVEMRCRRLPESAMPGRADRIVALAQRIARTTTAADAAPLVAELNDLAQALLSGVDANGDGRTGWQEGEGGLEVANTHLGFMKQAEGL